METRREVELPAATVDDVWPCVSEAGALGDWLGGTLTVDGAGSTLEPGAAGTFVDGRDGSVRHVLVEDVDPGRSVSWTWWTDDEDEAPSAVSIVLDPAGDACDGDMAEGAADGAADGAPAVRVVVVERQLAITGPVAMACV